jgi:hypothetical protein
METEVIYGIYRCPKCGYAVDRHELEKSIHHICTNDGCCFWGIETKESEFSAGDKVRIINKGQAYSDSRDIARALGATRWKPGGARAELNNGDVGVVSAISNPTFKFGSRGIALIDVREGQYLIDVEGLASATEEDNDGRGVVIPFWQ